MHLFSGRLTLPILLVGLALAGCGGSGTTVTSGEPDLSEVEVTDAYVPDGLVDLGTPDVAHKEVSEDIPLLDFSPPPDVGDLKHDTGPEYGDWNKPCQNNGDCESSFCIQVSEEEWVCTITCVEECPKDWQCKGVQTGPDMNFICVPPKGNLCKECTTDADCVYDKDRCLPIGQTGKYCAVDCSGDRPCPEHYTCAEIAIDGEEEPIYQCLPDTQSCVCTWELDGTAKECSVSNEAGKCYGDELCDGPNGWTECNAKTPAPETCDGLDNNCNGVIDEEMQPKPCVKMNQFGSCTGTDTCLGEAGWLCDAPEPQGDLDGDGLGDECDEDIDGDSVANPLDCQPYNPAVYPGATEVCDGIDNNCNLFVDEGYPDADGDGAVDCMDEDDDNDQDPDLSDCQQFNPQVGHGLPELCDGQDNNCNQQVDEGFDDTDGDGVADCVDKDSDGDGIDDFQDNCPLVPNSGQVNSDNDAMGDACDADDDNDGLVDDVDNCPLITNQDQSDIDGDMIGDVCDNDADGDGHPNILDCAPFNPETYPGAPEICDGFDNNCNLQVDEGYPDHDDDNLADCIDPDDDGDGDPDTDDCAPLDPTIFNGAAEVCDGLDSDCNGIADDDCPATGIRLRQVNSVIEGSTPDLKAHMVFGTGVSKTVQDDAQGIRLHWSKGY